MSHNMSHKIQASVQASLSFDFQGEHLTPSINVDLHSMMLKKQQLQDLYHALAISIGLDPYRHEYDVLVMSDITFSDATGLACDYLTDSHFDWDRFSAAWQMQRIITIIQPIAQQYLNISDLSQQHKMQQALIACYQAGQKNPETSAAKPMRLF